MHSSGISGIAYNGLKKRLGISGGETRIYDVIQQLALPEQWYLDRFSIDSVDLARVFAAEPSEWRDWSLPDGSPAKFPAWIDLEKRGKDWVCLNAKKEVIASMAGGAFYFSQAQYPLYGKQSERFDDLPDLLDKVSWVALKDPLWKNSAKKDSFPSIGQATRKLFEETDYCFTANYGSLFFEIGQYLYRNDEFFMKMLTEPKEIIGLFDKLAELHLANLGPFLEQVSPYADVIIFGDDLGMQTGPLISPQLYKEMVWPWHKKIFSFVKKNSRLKTFLHSCGSFFELIPYLIDAGLDILNPVQTQTAGMDAKSLKEKFGKDLVFWGGGIDTQHVLASGDEKAVRKEVRKNCEIFMKDGGFVFNPIHNMLPGIPPGNIVAMYEEVNSIGYW
jgi:uroporphyrinogen decarboxylase